MNRRRIPRFVLGLAVCAVAVIAEAWLVRGAAQRVARQETLLRQLKEERDWLARQSPRLTRETEDAIAMDLAAADERFAELSRALTGSGEWLPPPPTRSTDAFFALVAFVERMRAAAARQQVALQPDERFGFSTYVANGPETALLAKVHRQRVLVERMLESLFEAQPRSLGAMQRERPRPEGAEVGWPASDDSSAAERAGGRAEAATDFFRPTSPRQARVPQFVDRERFRLEFTGQTRALRLFVNSLAASRVPLLVRSIEVAPAPNGPGSNRAAPSAEEGAVVAESLTRFVVIVEFIDVRSAISS